MKTRKSIFSMLLLIALLAMPLMAFDTPEEPFNAAQWTVLTTFAMPIIAQVFKAYAKRGGKKISGRTIDLALIGASLILVFAWGEGLNYIVLEKPVFGADPWINIFAVVEYATSMVTAAGAIFGSAYVYFTGLRPTLFKWVPFLRPQS